MILNVKRINDDEEFKINIYDLDNQDSIRNRIASKLKTLPKYLFFYDDIGDILNEKIEEITVEDILLSVKNYGENNLYESLQEDDFETKIQDLKNISIIYDILKIYIAYNADEYYKSQKIDEKDFIEFILFDSMINDNDIDSIIKLDNNKYIKREYNEKIRLYWASRKNEKMLIEREIEKNENKLKNNDNILNNFDKINIDKINYDEFIIKRKKVSVNIKTNKKTTLLEIFNSIKLNETIPFTKCGEFYKVLKEFIPNNEWINEKNKDDIVLKLKTLNEYLDIIIKLNEEEIMMIFQYSETEIKEEQILDNVKNILKSIEISYDNLKSIGLNGYYMINDYINVLEVPLNTNIFTDLIMNNKIFSRHMTTNESEKADKTKFYLLFSLEKIGNITIQITTVNRNMKISILNCSDIDKIKTFQYIFSKFLMMYGNEYEDIKKFYEGYLSKDELNIFLKQKDEDSDEITETNEKQTKLKYIAPEIFINNYSGCGHKPIPLNTEEEYKEALEKGQYVMIYPKKLSSKEYKKLKNEGKNPIKIDIKNRFKLVCNDKDFKYPGLKENKNNIPLPCCYKVDQTNKKSKTEYLNYFDVVINENKHMFNFNETNEDDDEDDEEEVMNEVEGDEEEKIVDKSNKKQQNVITTDRILDNNKVGLLSKITNDFLSDESYTVYRKGSVRSNNSFIQCIIDALEQDELLRINEIENEEERNERIDEIIHIDDYDGVREELFELLPLCKQECYSMTIEEIENVLNDNKKYFDPSMFIRLLEYKYDVNIFVFRKDKDKENLVLPYHSKQYYKMKERKRCILVYEHFGTLRSYAKYPQCELIFIEKNDKTKQYIFNYTSDIIKKVKDVYNKLDNIIYYKDDKKVIRYSNGRLWFNNNEIVSQVCDNYGKTRGLIIKIDKEKYISLYMNPIPPLLINIISYNESLQYNLEDEDEIKNIMSKLKIKNIKKVKNVVLGFIEPYKNIYMEIKNLNKSVIETYNMYQKISRCVLEHLYYLYSIFINEKNETDYNKLISFTNLNEFIEKYIEIDENFNYQHVPNKLSLDNEGIIKDGKLVVKSEQSLKRLIYSLKLKIVREYNNIILYYNLENMDSYYLNINDFDSYDTQLLFKGHEFMSNWLNSIKKEQNLYNLYDKVLPNRNTIYFFQNKLIGNEIYIARNVKTIEEAVMFSLQWDINRYNPESVSTDSNIADEYKIILYSYINSKDIKKYYVNNEKEDRNIKILGYKDFIKTKNINNKILISKYTVLLKF